MPITKDLLDELMKDYRSPQEVPDFLGGCEAADDFGNISFYVVIVNRLCSCDSPFLHSVRVGISFR